MSKRPVVGIDTKRSARVVKDRVLKELRGEGPKKNRRRKPMMIGASAALAVVAVLFLVLQLQNPAQEGQKLTTTAPNDRLLVEVHQLTEENKKEVGAEYLSDRENLADNKALIVKYFVKKKPGEIIEANFDQVFIQFKERISGPNDERAVTTSSGEQNNQSEAFAEFSYTLLFQTQGLTDEDIHAALREAVIEVTYTNLKGEKTVDTFTLENYAKYIGIAEQLAEDGPTVYPSSFSYSADDFIYSLEIKEPQISKGMPFEMTASLTYVGEEESVTIVHAASPFYYDITEMTRGFKLDYAMDQPAISTELKKGEPLQHQYRLTGGYSDQDSEEFRAFVDQFLAGLTPEGTYKVHGYVQFQIEGETEQTELGGHIGFEVK